jgi:hypothetical protein
MDTPPYDLVIGLDRSDRKADLHLIGVADQHRQTQTIDTSPEALWEWLLQLRQEHPQGRIALCLEQPAAHLMAYLEAYEWITLYPINPITLQKYREAFVTSRAKDDTKDARYLAELLLAHHDKLKLWAPEDEPTRAIQQLVFHRRSVVNERVGLTNRLKDLLKQYFPQALVLCGEDIWRPLATRFLLKWPSLQAVQKAKTERLKEFYHLNGSRSARLMEQRLALIEKAVPVTDQAAVVDSFILRVQLICRQLQDVVQTIKTFDLRIAQVFNEHDDHEIFASLPGAGRCWLLACWQRWVLSANALKVRPTCRITLASRPSPNRAAANAIFTGATFVQSSIGKPSTNTPGKAFFGAAGRQPFTCNSAPKALITTPQFAHWLTNGNASSGVAGKVENPTKKRLTKPRYGRAEVLW